MDKSLSNKRKSIWDTHTPEFSAGFPAEFLSLPACKSAMLVPWLAHALKSSRRKVLRDAITASSGVSAAHFYAEATR
ncbi:hypothetical protein [Tahibacter harae]|uniref:Uncharacterized protein n=1 Tax=Tahibacter harae TaxID=2963937 RepID=A0ABT1QWL9_9GAMM|nr:hypothetical protein [Tahibacter harae]MCQ4166681.1 hypothetical protein [Tahibacter harae]